MAPSVRPADARRASRSTSPTAQYPPPTTQAGLRKAAHSRAACRLRRRAIPTAPAALATAPPSNTPRDEYDLGIGYMQRKDYALAEETMKNFAQKYPGDPLVGDSQYWLGESYFQRQQYRDAAEVFLTVTSKYDKSAKAPDALLRLGQSLAALKEKEAACAAFGEIDAQISARLPRRQSHRRPRAEAGEVLSPSARRT